jgi:branched-subunit amino acid ABC-type transport system permease component
VGAQVLGGVNATTGGDVIFVAIAVCIVGGAGSVQGALLGALLIGIITSVAEAYLPSAAIYMMYILMIIILVVKPSGIVGRAS